MNPDSFKIEELFLFRQLPGAHPFPIQIPSGIIRTELMLEGSAWISDGTSYRLIQPAILVINQHEDWTLSRDATGEGFVCLAINIRTCAETTRVSLPRFTPWFDGVEHARLFSRRCERFFMDKRFNQAALARMIIGELLFQISAGELQRETEEIPEPILSIEQYLKVNFHRKISLDQLARRAGYSRSRFHELFLKHFQTTPFQFQMDLKIREAKRKLLQTRESAKWIAAECGFTSASAFSTAFLRESGKSPSEFRRIHQRLVGI